MDEGDGESREGSRTSSVELSIDGLEGLADLATTPPAVVPLALRRSASSFRAFLHAAGAGGARMHLASFWDQFYETHPCVDAGFEWYASWNDVAAVLAGRQDEPQLGSSQGHSRQQVLISGVGDDANFCAGLQRAGYCCVLGVDFSRSALERCQCLLDAMAAEVHELFPTRSSHSAPLSCPLALVRGDLRALPLRRGSFDLVVDKATLDGIISDGSPEAAHRGAATLRSLHSARTSDGTMAVITLLEDHVIEALVKFFLNLQGDGMQPEEMKVRALSHRGHSDSRGAAAKRPPYLVCIGRPPCTGCSRSVLPPSDRGSGLWCEMRPHDVSNDGAAVEVRVFGCGHRHDGETTGRPDASAEGGLNQGSVWWIAPEAAEEGVQAAIIQARDAVVLAQAREHDDG